MTIFQRLLCEGLPSLKTHLRDLLTDAPQPTRRHKLVALPSTTIGCLRYWGIVPQSNVASLRGGWPVGDDPSPPESAEVSVQVAPCLETQTAF